MIAYKIDDLSSTENFAEESLHYDTLLREKLKKVQISRFLPRSPTRIYDIKNCDVKSHGYAI
jgi:hypothetical protein